MPGSHCPPRTAQDCSGNLCYTKLMHLFNRFFFNLAVGVGSGGGPAQYVKSGSMVAFDWL